MSAAPRYNPSAPAVKRILQEIKEIEREGGADLVAEALEDDIFQWFFAIRGARGSDFDGGIYVGRILLPPEFPMRPPSFVLLTPSGRFETGVKICLSISQFHEQDGLWSPSWSIRTALVALIPFFDTPGGGAIGALDWAPADRRELAAKAGAAPPQAGLGPERQAVIDRLHAKLKARMVEEAEAERAAAGHDEGAAASQPAAAAAEPAATAAAGDGLRQRAVPAPAPATPPAAPAPRRPAPAAAAEWEDALLTVVAALLVLLIGVCLARSALRTLGAAVQSV